MVLVHHRHRLPMGSVVNPLKHRQQGHLVSVSARGPPMTVLCPRFTCLPGGCSSTPERTPGSPPECRPLCGSGRDGASSLVLMGRVQEAERLRGGSDGCTKRDEIDHHSFSLRYHEARDNWSNSKHKRSFFL